MIHVHSLVIRDGESGEVLCEQTLDEEPRQTSDGRGDVVGRGARTVVELPVKVLKCDAVSREVVFRSSSRNAIENLSIIQRVMVGNDKRNENPPSLGGDVVGSGGRSTCVEEWVFDFGFVMPGSTNSWQSVVTAARDGAGQSVGMRGAEFVIETNFYDGGSFLCRRSVDVRYV